MYRNYDRNTSTVDLSLQSQSSLWIGNLDTDSLGSGQKSNSVLGGNVVGNLSGIQFVVHQQSVQLLYVSDCDDLLSVNVQELGLLVRTVTDLWSINGTSESSSDTRVDTLLKSPVLVHPLETVRLVSLELLCVLLHDLWS